MQFHCLLLILCLLSFTEALEKRWNKFYGHNLQELANESMLTRQDIPLLSQLILKKCGDYRKIRMVPAPLNLNDVFVSNPKNNVDGTGNSRVFAGFNQDSSVEFRGGFYHPASVSDEVWDGVVQNVNSLLESIVAMLPPVKLRSATLETVSSSDEDKPEPTLKFLLSRIGHLNSESKATLKEAVYQKLLDLEREGYTIDKRGMEPKYFRITFATMKEGKRVVMKRPLEVLGVKAFGFHVTDMNVANDGDYSIGFMLSEEASVLLDDMFNTL